MSPFRSRRVLPAVMCLLAGAAALGLASCAPAGNRADSANGPFDSANKGQSMLKVGDASRQAGDCEAAIRFYRMVKDQDDNHRDAAAAQIGAADCELSMGALPAAEHDYRLAMGAMPQDTAPLIGLGRIALVQHKPAEAAAYLDQAIKKGADDAFVWNDRGVADDQLRQHKEAQQAYRQGLAKLPADRALRNNLALSLAMTRDFAEAETLLQALAAEPDATARTRQNLALVLGLEGKIAEARQIAQNDLDGAALDNNSRFYQYARAMITGAPLPTEASALDSDGDATAPAAQAEATPVPPPVLVSNEPLRGLRAAEPTNFEQRAAAVATADLPPPPATAVTPGAAAPSPAQTAALPAAPNSSDPAKAAAPVAAPAPIAGTPTRIVAANGGALKDDAQAQTADPVASSENR